MSLNMFAKRFLSLPTNLENLSSSRRISEERPRLNPPSAAILDSGTQSAL
jgi:hypothetical protein